MRENATECDREFVEVSGRKTTENRENNGRSRKSRMKRRTDDWEAAKLEVAAELGLLEKVQSEGWAGLTAAESGKIGGVLCRKYPGRAPQYAPGSRRSGDK